MREDLVVFTSILTILVIFSTANTIDEKIRKNAIKAFIDTPGNIEDKYEDFKVLVRTFIASFGNVNSSIVRYYQFVSNITEQEYETFTSPKILRRLNSTERKFNFCFEFYYFRGESVNDFCGYNISEALNCARNVIVDDLHYMAGLEAFINHWKFEFDCKSNKIDPELQATYAYIIGAPDVDKHQLLYEGFLQEVYGFVSYADSSEQITPMV